MMHQTLTPRLILSDNLELILKPHVPVELKIEHTIHVGPLETGRVVHPVYLIGCIPPVYGPIMLIGVQGLFLKRGIWVEVSMVEDGVLETSLFNMGNKRVRLGKEDCISHLIWLAKPVYHTQQKERKR